MDTQKLASDSDINQTSSRIKGLGFVITAVWVIIIVTYVCVQRKPVLGMEPAEFGDFISGMVAPIAFLWFILGYFQQGLELHQNTQQLHLQWQELANSVQEQKRLVAQVTKQTEAIELSRKAEIKAAEPKFVYTGTGSGKSSGRQPLKVSFVNKGGPITIIDFDSTVVGDSRMSPNDFYQTEQKGHWFFQEIDPDNFQPIEVTVVYENRFGRETVRFKIPAHRKPFVEMEPIDETNRG